MEWLGRLIPQIIIVRKTHAGVKFVRGHRVVELQPGLHWYWPIMTEIEKHPVARQTHNLCTQVMLTKDRQQVVVGGVVVYTITDIGAALSQNWDIDDTVSDITQTAIVDVVTSWTLDELITKLTTDVKKDLTQTTRDALKPYGIRVIKCALTDFSTCQVLKLVSDNAPVPVETVASTVPR